jgi:Ca-activated chloride channel family protein
VSFQSPLLLLTLLLLPVAALLYRAHSRRAERAAAAFASPALLDSVAPRRPGWRRHVPYALYALAVAGLALALARPEITVAVPDERASIVLATDTSGSMQATDVPPSRLVAAREAGLEFLDGVPREVRVGAVVFNHAVRSVETPTTDRAPVERTLERLRPSGGTATGEALAGALGLVRDSGVRGRPAPAAIVLLSDGASTHGREPLPVAEEAARLDIPVYTVALGTDTGSIEVETPNGTRTRPVPPDRDTLRRLAETSGGRYFEADDRPELDEVYERLGSQVATRDEPREITAALAGAGALLLLGGGGLSLHWFRRLP